MTKMKRKQGCRLAPCCMVLQVLIEWGDKGPSKKYVKKDVSKQIHEKVAQFINWLKEADEESSDEEEEEEVEVSSLYLIRILKVQVLVSNLHIKQTNQNTIKPLDSILPYGLKRSVMQILYMQSTTS